MKYLFLGLFLVGCASPHLISEKDTAWVSSGVFFNQSIYYCERLSVKGVMLPVCTEANLISDWVRLEKFQQIQDIQKTK